MTTPDDFHATALADWESGGSITGPTVLSSYDLPDLERSVARLNAANPAAAAYLVAARTVVKPETSAERERRRLEDQADPATMAELAARSSTNGTGDDWPTLDWRALHGVVGEVAALLDPVTEADRAAIVVTFLAVAGAVIGSGPHAVAGHARHPARLSPVIVGETSKARKGTSYGAVRSIWSLVNPEFMHTRTMSGFGSGEALVDEVRDADGDDPGADDKRILLHDPEFGRVLRVCNREGSTLSAVIRDAWDGTRLQVRTRARKVVATDHHVAIVGHISADELQRNLTATEIASGFANRLLFVCARRSKRLPFGGDPDQARLDDIVRRLRRTVDRARKVGLVHFATDARPLWVELYNEMGDDDPGGLLGAVVQRPEAQMLRLTLTYMLLDDAKEMREDHIRAAWAVWQYSRASAERVFGDATGDEVADRLLDAITDAGQTGLTSTEMIHLFSRHVSAARLTAATKLLEDKGLIVTEQVKTGGRPKTVTRRSSAK